MLLFQDKQDLFFWFFFFFRDSDTSVKDLKYILPCLRESGSLSYLHSYLKPYWQRRSWAPHVLVPARQAKHGSIDLELAPSQDSSLL